MTIYRNAGAGFVQAQQPYIKVAGAWVPAVQVYKKIAGVWTLGWPDVPVGGGPGSVQLFGNYLDSNDVVINLTLDTLGQVNSSSVGFVPYNWLISGSPSQYEILCQLTSGGLSSGPVGTWVNLGTTRTWARNAVGTAIAQFSIRRVSDQLLLTGPVEITFVRQFAAGGGGGVLIP